MAHASPTILNENELNNPMKRETCSTGFKKNKNL